jgi:transposase-like protein
MASRRLNDSDKQEILELYRQPGETTLTIADRYGVSNTTISRILKSSLSAEEYDRLIQQKRSQRFATDVPGQGSLLDDEDFVEEETVEEVEEEELIPEPVVSKPARVVPAPIKRVKKSGDEAAPITAEVLTQKTDSAEAAVIEEIIGEDLSGRGLLDEEDDFGDLDDEFDDDDDDDDDGAGLPTLQVRSAELVRVLPLADAAIPKTCYLVVDRGAELVARPLSEFAELGQIPSGEVEAKTLPVFDNHRVARRFSNIRTQRVIKVPDSRILRKTASHLQQKGITRLLIDGQVYAL